MAAKYQQLAGILRSELSSVAKQGGKLPTEAELSRRYHMSRQTVRHALQLLTEEGLVFSRQGSGTFLSPPAPKQSAGPIAVITTFLDDYIFPKILHDVQSVFSESGYSIIVFSTDNLVSREREILQELLSMPISGVLAEGTKSALPSPNTDLYLRMHNKGVPILFLHGIYSNLTGFPCVSDANESGGYILTRYLLEKGHRNIAAFLKSDDMQGPQRYQGIVCALRDRDIPIPDGRFFWYDTDRRRELIDSKQSDYLLNIIQHHMDGVSAVICYNDEIANLLIKRLLDLGRRVPEEMAVVSFDDSYYSQICPVPITSLCHRIPRTGQAAAQILLDMLNGQPPQSMAIGWELVRRKSG